MLGKPVPDFSLASTGGTTFKLSGTRGAKTPHGISRDSFESREGFMKHKNRYGRKVRGIRAQRSSPPGDACAREWRGVKVPGHVQEVLNFVKAL